MTIFGTITGKIFGTHTEAAPAALAPEKTHGATPIQTVGKTPKAAPSTQSSPQSSSTIGQSHAATPVEVDPILDAAVKSKCEKLEWRTSIVDLMKALDIDFSLKARKELAKELHYTADTNDSASMNV